MFFKFQRDSNVVAADMAYRSLAILKSGGCAPYFYMFHKGKALIEFRFMDQKEWLDITLKSNAGEFCLLSDFLEELDKLKVRFIRYSDPSIYENKQYYLSICSTNSLFQGEPQYKMNYYSIFPDFVKSGGFDKDKEGFKNRYRNKVFKIYAEDIRQKCLQGFSMESSSINLKTISDKFGRLTTAHHLFSDYLK